MDPRSHILRRQAWSEALINESLAVQLFGSLNIIGSEVFPAGTAAPTRIVGIVGDAFDAAFDAKPVSTIYVAMTRPRAGGLPMHYVVAGSVSPEHVQRAVTKSDGEGAVLDVSPVRQRLLDTVRDRTFATVTGAFLATTAVTLALIGLVAVVRQSLARRQRELAVRYALGASPWMLRWAVIAEAVRATSIGVSAGLLGQVLLRPAIQGRVYGLEANPWYDYFAPGIFAFFCSAMLAMITAKRAETVEVARVLRSQ